MIEVPPGLEGVVAAQTEIGDVRGEEGFYHYRQYDAVALAAARSYEDVAHLLLRGWLPQGAEGPEFARLLAARRAIPPKVEAVLAGLVTTRAGGPLDVLRTAVSALGLEEGWGPWIAEGGAVGAEADRRAGYEAALRLVAVTPTLVAAAWRLGLGLAPIAPDPALGHAGNYLWMLHGERPSDAQARALDQYLVIASDHGFNASTFTARVIASTGADIAACITGAIGALSGPLHGGAPSRALAMLDAIGQPERAEAWVRDALASGQRIMGFGHRVYRTEDPRAAFLKGVAADLGSPTAAFALEVERTVVAVLAEVKPGRRLYANVELYAGVVMEACGVDRDLFTPTFASARVAGWCAHVLEQMGANRLIRPLARYCGPDAPQPVPPADDSGAATAA
jgi:citrate synthase